MRVMASIVRGVAAALAVNWMIEALTGHPGVSMAIIWGLFLGVPVPGWRAAAKSMLILAAVTALHIYHTLVLGLFNALWEFGVVMVSWSLVLWVQVTERWRIGGKGG